MNRLLTNLRKLPEYGGFKQGDTVTIKGEQETRYRFNGVIINDRTGSVSAELFGGRKGRGPQLRGQTSGYRAVTPDKLKKVKW